MEHNLSSVTTENQKLLRIIETNQQRIKDLQQDFQSIENENQKLINNVDSLKLSVRKYHDLERETTNLETVNHRLEQEMKGLEKENNRLKTAIEVSRFIIYYQLLCFPSLCYSRRHVGVVGCKGVPKKFLEFFFPSHIR